MLCAVLAFLTAAGLMIAHFVFENREKDFDTLWSERWQQMHNRIKHTIYNMLHNATNNTGYSDYTDHNVGTRRPWNISHNALTRGDWT